MTCPRQRGLGPAPRLEFALPADAPVAACLEALGLPVRVGVGTDLEDVFLRVGGGEERRANLLSALPRRRTSRAPTTATRGARCAVLTLVTKRLRLAWHDPGRRHCPSLYRRGAVLAFACNARDDFSARGSFRERDDVRHLHARLRAARELNA